MKTYFEVPGVKDFYSFNIGLVEIDPEISKAIQILNQKGYKTIASCAGHLDKKIQGRAHGYILMEDYPDEALPEGFVMTGRRRSGSDRMVLRWRANTKKILEKQHKDLLEWAKDVRNLYG